MTESTSAYASVGVDYDLIDPFKKLALAAGKETERVLSRFGFQAVEWSRGGSCPLIETPWGYIAYVEEGLGTKNLVTDMWDIEHSSSPSLYDAVAQDAVAMIVNDMLTVGARPFSMTMHLAVGMSSWFNNEDRVAQLVVGWKRACIQAGCAWMGGETPTLRNLVVAGGTILSGSAVGIVAPKEQVIDPRRIEEGDAIILLGGTGLGANGFTLAREIAAKLPDGYRTRLKVGTTFGEELLQPTPIYASVIEACRALAIHGAVHITGHGWRKLNMRTPEPFVYVIEHIHAPQPVFGFIQEHAGLVGREVSDQEMYETFNMGAQFALIVPPCSVAPILAVAQTRSIMAWQAGYVEKRGSERKVIIRPKGIEI